MPPTVLNTINPDNISKHLGCILMASGSGKRFGGNKLMADFHGKPLILWALETTEGIFSNRIVVTRHPEIEQLCLSRGCQVLLHTLPYRNDTIRLGLDTMDAIDGCLFYPSDQPLLQRSTLLAMVQAASCDPHSIWRISFENTPGSPVLFPKWTFAELKNLSQNKGGRELIKKYSNQVRYISAQNKYELMDIDTPQDLSTLLNITIA